mmetsp:Transcript_7588/g.19308  ORF Transcript_7588/g.19308 Transcript_7588/m.19308 type:complete len:392 (+) Transcript_7588:161-1336(+)
MRRAPAVRRHRGHPGAWEVAVAHHEQTLEGRGGGGDGDGVRVRRDPPRAAVGALVPPQEPGLGERGAHHLHLHPLPHVRDGLLHRAPQHLRALLLQPLVLVALAVQPLPQRQGLVARRVRVDHVLARGRQRGVQHRGDGHQHHVLLRRDPPRPVLHVDVVDLQVVRQPRGVDAQVQVHEGGAQLRVHGLLHPLLGHGALGQHGDGVPQRGVADHGPAGVDHPAAAQHHPRGALVLHRDGLHVRPQQQPPSVLLQPPHQRLHDGPAAAHRELQRAVGAVPVVEHVADLRRQGAAGRGARQQEAQHLHPVADERMLDLVLVHEFRVRRHDLGQLRRRLEQPGQEAREGDEGGGVRAHRGGRQRGGRRGQRLHQLLQLLPLLHGVVVHELLQHV